MPHWKIPSDDDYDRLNGLDRNECQICGGLGEVLADNAYQPCPAPDCEAGQRARAVLQQRMTAVSKVPRQYASATLDDLTTLPNHKRRGKTVAFTACQHYADYLSVDGQPWLMLYGPVGTGKTYAACAIVNHINRERGKPARYIRLDDLLREVRDGYDYNADQSASQVIHRYQDAPVLLIDEMNLNRITDHTAEIAESIIRYRYMNELPTIFTANTNQEDFTAMWGDRISTVVMDMALWAHVGGESLRDNKPSIGGDHDG